MLEESILLVLLIAFAPSLFIVRHIICYTRYTKTSYYKITNNSYFDIIFNKGLAGEYSIYKKLKNYENDGAKILFNLYIPTYNNKTTEIDVVMISTKGLFVIESKNYSGWIFGRENQRKWTQSFHIGYGETQKEYFYNPIMQNEYHIKYLKKIIGDNINIHSLIVFLDSCKLKNIKLKENSSNYVIYLSQLKTVITQIFNNQQDILYPRQVDELYNKLYAYSQADESIKLKHVSDLKYNPLR